MPSSISRRRERTAVPRSRFLPGPRPRRIAHRGFALDGAENTMRAFEDALAAGADMLETDTRATRDGLALAVHDEDLLRVAGDERRIDEIGAREA
ncbi:MAG: glycerophosphodiester phosphodiesterase, partial [Actinomycetales bacterium]|nr:glycerophosphodiester phosphodiesterase [Actinomycetales bacterium]